MKKTSNIASAKKFRDGQNRTSAIDPVERLHEGLVFEHRFVPPEDAEAIQQEVQESKTHRDGYRKMCHVLAAKIVGWSEDCDVTFDHCRMLPKLVGMSAYRIILGLQASDPLPSEMVEQDSEDEEERLESLLGERGPAEGAAKN